MARTRNTQTVPAETATAPTWDDALAALATVSGLMGAIKQTGKNNSDYAARVSAHLSGAQSQMAEGRDSERNEKAERKAQAARSKQARIDAVANSEARLLAAQGELERAKESLKAEEAKV